MRSRDIAAMLLRGGYRHDNPRMLANAIFSALSRRNDKFMRVGRGLWTLREFKTAGLLEFPEYDSGNLETAEESQ
jgi:hypothetical protein